MAMKHEDWKQRKGDTVTDEFTTYWLAELDNYGTPKLMDGPHDNRNGADEALYLIKRLGLFDQSKKYAIAKVVVSEPDDKDHDINEEAADNVRQLVEWSNIR